MPITACELLYERVLPALGVEQEGLVRDFGRDPA
jgi:hypothetical protein